MTKLAIDLSQHNYISQSQWDALATVVDGVIVRLSYGVTLDIAAEDHIANARSRGLGVAGYHWSDPTWDFQRQLSVALYAIKLHGVAGWFSDVEQWWSDWAAWARGDNVALAASKIPSSVLNTFYRNFATAVDAGTDKPIGNYSSDRWFIPGYCPELANWIYANNYWNAAYVKYEAWWVEYLAKHPTIDAAGLHEISQLIPIYRGIGTQWTSNIPGEFPHIDMNVFTDEGFLRMFGIPGKPDGVIPPEPVVTNYITLDDVWVRDVPNGLNKVGYRHKGETVTSYDKSMGWVLVQPITEQGGAKGWIAAVLLAPQGSMYRVTAAALWIRDVPNGVKISYLWHDAVVQVDKVGLNGWVHIVAAGGKPAGWVNSYYLIGG